MMIKAELPRIQCYNTKQNDMCHLKPFNKNNKESPGQ